MKAPARFGLLAASVVALLGFASPARASLVPPGAISVGATVVDTISHSFSVGPVSSRTSGTITEWVIKGNQANSSLLSFVFQIKATAGSTRAPGIEHLSTIDFTGFTSVLSQATTGTLAATPGSVVGVTSSINGTISPDTSTIDFDFASNSLIVGKSSKLLIIDTNATAYDKFGIVNLIDGSTFSGSAAEPVGRPFVSTPEPASAIMLVGCFLGAGGFGAIRRWRQNRGA